MRPSQVVSKTRNVEVCDVMLTTTSWVYSSWITTSEIIPRGQRTRASSVSKDVAGPSVPSTWASITPTGRRSRDTTG
jgi:hypothetical protein